MDWQGILSYKSIQVILSITLALLVSTYLIKIQLIALIISLVVFGILAFLYKKYSHMLQPIPLLLVKLLAMLGFLHSFLILATVGSITIFPFRALVPIVLLMFMIQYLANDQMLLRWNQVQVKPILAFFAFWICYGLLSLIWVKSFSDGFIEMILLVMGTSFIFLFVFYFSRLRDYLDLFYIWLGMLVILLGIGCWEIATGHHLSVSAYSAFHGYHIPTGVFTNQNDYATYLTISFFFLVSFVKYIKDKHFKVYGIILTFILLYVNFKTQSRANLLALAIGLIFYLLFLTTRKAKLRFLIFAVPLAIIVGIVFQQGLSKYVIHFIHSLSLNGSSGGNQSDQIRVHLIENSLVFLSHTFGFGVGSGNAKYYMAHYELFPTLGIAPVHNWWVKILVEYGLFVFVGYVLVFVTLMVSLFKALKRTVNRHEKMICEGLLGAFFAFPIACISSSSIMAFKFQWIFIAFAIGYLNYLRLKNKRMKWGKHNVSDRQSSSN